MTELTRDTWGYIYGCIYITYMSIYVVYVRLVLTNTSVMYMSICMGTGACLRFSSSASTSRG